MPYFVKAKVDDHTILATAGTAMEAFAKAIDWQIKKQLDNVTISDGRSDHSIAEFSAAMAQSEIAPTRDSF
jgi:hypothetical protein